MKIASTPADALAASGLGARPARESGATPAAAAPAAEAGQVRLSGAASHMDLGGDFDQAKVDSIRQAIREGRFTVNPEAIADRLIADAATLLAPRTAG